MNEYWKIITDSYTGYRNYLSQEILNPGRNNYFYWRIGLSIGVRPLEIFLAWRKNQFTFRKYFWLDGFYMFFNFFLFSLIFYNGLSNVAVNALTII